MLLVLVLAHAGVDVVVVVLSLRSSSSFLAVMRIRVSWMVQFPLRYSLANEEEEGGGGGAVAPPWMRGRWWWRCGSGMIDCGGNGVVEGSDMVLIKLACV